MKKFYFTLNYFTLLMLFVGVNAYGQIIKVPQDYSKIQDAINAANNHDTVLVSPGTYLENINFRGKNIVVASNFLLDGNPQHILETIIDGSNASIGDTASCVAFLKNEDSTAVIQGFTLTNGKGTYLINNGNILLEGGAIIMRYSSATIKNNLIINNMAPAGGGGIAAFNGGTPHIYNNIIANNTSGYAGGIVLNWCGGIIRNNIVHQNTTTGQWGSGGIMVWSNGKPAWVENNTIVGNSSNTSAGGISTNITGIAYIRNNIIYGNKQQVGGEVSLYVASNYTYNNSSGLLSGIGNIAGHPLFADSMFILEPESHCIDAGDTCVNYDDIEDFTNPGNALYPSKNTLRNDMGAYGGPFVNVFPKYTAENIFADPLTFWMNKNDTLTENLIISNTSTHTLHIDSIVFPEQLRGLQNTENLKDFSIPPIEIDTIPITIIAKDSILIYDSIRIYHNGKLLLNPFKVKFYFDTKHEFGETDQNIRAHWKFNETSGSFIKDEKGLSNGSIINNADRIAGVEGRAIGFTKNAINARIEISHTDSIDFNPDESFTVSMLVKSDPIAYITEVFPLIKGTTGGLGKWYAFSFKNKELRFNIDDNITKSFARFVLPSDYNPKIWHQIAGVRDRETDKIYLYLDGNLVGNANDLTEQSIFSGLPILITNFNSNGNTGVEDVRIYNKALSATFIEALYKSYGELGASNDASLSNLEVTGYNFNEGPFNSELHNYSVDVTQGTSHVSITGTPTNYFAEITGTGTFSTLPGTATITVTSEDGLVNNPYAITFSVETSINNLQNLNTINVFPNPAYGQLNITIPSNLKGQEIKIYTASGKIIITKTICTNNFVLDVSEFNQGLYFLKINNLTKKFIIK